MEATTEEAGGAARDLQAFEELARSARLSDLVMLARGVLDDMSGSRRAVWTGSLREKTDELKLSSDELKTGFGDVGAVLERGPEDDAERALARALAAHVLAESAPRRADDEDKVAGDLLWHATSTPFDATSLIDRALGEEASGYLWKAVAARVRAFDAHRAGAASLGRGEALLACAALATSSSKVAQAELVKLARDLKDPLLHRVARPAVASGSLRVEGEMSPTPRGPLVTIALALTGILFVAHALRFLAKVALAYRRPTTVTLSSDGVRIESRTEVLGRPLRERRQVMGRDALLRVAREVRYPRLGLLAGLLALAAGSYLGVSMIADGGRAASPTLILTGLAVIAAGVGLEILAGYLPAARGRCRLLVVPTKGPTVCVAAADLERVDAALAKLI